MENIVNDTQADGAAEQERGLTRRDLLYGVGVSLVLLGMGGGAKLLPQSAVVRPPGGQDELSFLSACVRCERCVEICPHDAIKLTHLEDGLLSARTPQMNFSTSYCDFCESVSPGEPMCIAACGTGALEKLVDASKGWRIGCASIVSDWCLAYQGTGCKVCYDSCPYDAIRLDGLNRPYVINDACNGCGACEAACVSLTNGSRSIAPDATSRAITVKPDTAL